MQSSQREPIPTENAERASSCAPRAALRLGAAVGATLFLMPFCMLHLAALRNRSSRLRAAEAWTGFWGRMICRLAGIRVVAHGPLPPRGVLLASNHVGYADIAALLSLLPCFFTPKSDIRRWPLIGWIVWLAGHPLIDRRSTRSLVEASRRIAERLEAGANVCVFPESTTSGGDGVLPFKAALLQTAIDRSALVAPVGLRWSASDPAVRVSEDIAYWRPDHHFGCHVWRLTGLSGVRVDVHFGRPIDSTGLNRRELAETLRDEIVRLAGLA